MTLASVGPFTSIRFILMLRLTKFLFPDIFLFRIAYHALITLASALAFLRLHLYDDGSAAFWSVAVGLLCASAAEHARVISASRAPATASTDPACCRDPLPAAPDADGIEDVGGAKTSPLWALLPPARASESPPL